MIIFKKTIAIVLSTLVLTSTVFAEDNTTTQTFQATTDGTNITVAETDLYANVNNSNLTVKVIRQVGEHSATVYEGLLGGYENGAWNNIDFSGINLLVLLEWDSDEVIYIIPTSEQTSQNSANAISDTQQENAQNNNENILNNSETVSITSQIKLNGVNVGETGLRIIDNANMQCDFSISNTSETAKSTAVILATYSSTGALVNVETFSTEIDENDTENISFVYQFNGETEHSARLMFWNSLSGMMPIRAKVDFSQNTGINAYYYNQDNRLIQIDKANGTSILYTYDNMGSLLTKIVRK